MALDLIPKLTWLEPATLRQAILSTLAYADVFDYPLTASEIHRYLVIAGATFPQLESALGEMAAACAIVRAGEYFALPGREALFAIRRRRSEIAVPLWRKALRYGRILSALPFVRMVAVTGSLAMCNADLNMDIDLMLVTTPGRLWTCRALVIAVTRLARLEGVTLCPNYMVTTNALTFQERSLYVAHELAQMIPLSGMELYAEVRALNGWTRDYLPNAEGAPQPLSTHDHTTRWQQRWEAVLKHVPIARIEAWEMQRKVGQLSRQQSASREAYFSADVCKGHKDQHAQRTELELGTRLQRLKSL